MAMSQIEIQHRAVGDYYCLTHPLAFVEAGLPPIGGGDLVAVAVYRRGNPLSSVAAVVDTLANTVEPLHAAMSGAMIHLQQAYLAAGFPAPKRWLSIEANGWVNNYSPHGACLGPVISGLWQPGSIEAMVRSHECGTGLWLEVTRALELHAVPVLADSVTASAAAGRAPSRSIGTVTAEAGLVQPSAGTGATVVTGSAMTGATVVGVSDDGRRIRVCRDLLTDCAHELATLVPRVPAAAYCATVLVPSETFCFTDDAGWTLLGSKDTKLLLGTRLYRPGPGL